MRIVIVGAGKVGFSLAQRLSEEGHEITVIEQDEERRLIVQTNLDVMTISGNGASPHFLADLALQKTDLLVAVTDRDEVNMIACMAAKQLGIPRTIARVRNEGQKHYKQHNDSHAAKPMGHATPEQNALREDFNIVNNARSCCR